MTQQRDNNNMKRSGRIYVSLLSHKGIDVVIFDAAVINSAAAVDVHDIIRITNIEEWFLQTAVSLINFTNDVEIQDLYIQEGDAY